jgi:hypothetical protein
VSENYPETRPSFPLTPAGRGHRQLFMVLVRLFRRFAVKELVAIEATAVYCSGPGGQNGNSCLIEDVWKRE